MSVWPCTMGADLQCSAAKTRRASTRATGAGAQIQQLKLTISQGTPTPKAGITLAAVEVLSQASRAAPPYSAVGRILMRNLLAI